VSEDLNDVGSRGGCQGKGDLLLGGLGSASDADLHEIVRVQLAIEGGYHRFVYAPGPHVDGGLEVVAECTQFSTLAAGQGRHDVKAV
jgi:hypothetical protein